MPSLKIHKSLLPKNIAKLQHTDKEGFIHGDMFFSESDKLAEFITLKETKISLTKPTLIKITDKQMNYFACILNENNHALTPTELIFFFAK